MDALRRGVPRTERTHGAAAPDDPQTVRRGHAGSAGRKYLCLNSRGALCAISTLTNDLDAWPLISAAYFQRRFPKHHAERRIWWVGFVAVDPYLGRPVHAFERLVAAMQKMVADHHGVVGLDTCRYNTNARRLPQAVNQLVRRLTPTVRIDNADEQTYWLYEFPPPDGAQ